MSLYNSTGPQVPQNAIIEYGAKYDGEYNSYYYQVSQSSYLVIYIPENPKYCSKNTAIYYSTLSNVTRIALNQYADMSYVSSAISVVNKYYMILNVHYPKYFKYMGKITKELYNLFELPISDQVNILTTNHKYLSVDLRIIPDLFKLEIQDIYDPNHYIPQEYIKRRIDAMPKPAISEPQAEYHARQNTEQHAKQNTEQLDDLGCTKKINISESEIKKREPQRLNAARYIAIRRRRHI
jgi:hypothetical protein